MTKDLVSAQIQTGNLSPENMQDAMQCIFQTLTTLKRREESGVPAAQTQTVDWRTSITQHAVTCLECGQSFRQLSMRHLRQHNLDARSYREKSAYLERSP